MRRTIVLLFILFACVGLFVGCGLDESQMKEKTKAVAKVGPHYGTKVSAPKSCSWWEQARPCPDINNKEETMVRTCPDGTSMTCTRKVSKKRGRLSLEHCMCIYEEVNRTKWDCPQECKTVVQTPDGK